MKRILLSTITLLSVAQATHATDTQDVLITGLEEAIKNCDVQTFSAKYQEMSHNATRSNQDQTALTTTLKGSIQVVKAHKQLELKIALSKPYIQNRFHAWRTSLWGIPALLASGLTFGSIKDKDTTGTAIALPLALCLGYKAYHNGYRAIRYSEILKNDIVALDQMSDLLNQPTV